MRIRAPRGVYRPRGDTALLIQTVLAHRPNRRATALELCTGSGLVALSLAAEGHVTVAVDLSRRAAFAARMNARANGLTLDVRQGNLFAPVAGRRFDLIVSNPPYVPAPPGEEARGASRAWNAGSDGRSILDPLCAGLPDHLTEGGTAFIVHSSLADLGATQASLRARGLEVDVVASIWEPLGPIAASRAAFLHETGLARGGLEQMAVIRAVRPVAGAAVSVSTRHRLDPVSALEARDLPGADHRPAPVGGARDGQRAA